MKRKKSSNGVNFFEIWVTNFGSGPASVHAHITQKCSLLIKKLPEAECLLEACLWVYMP
jgi:hypothetical protein